MMVVVVVVVEIEIILQFQILRQVQLLTRRRAEQPLTPDRAVRL